MSLLTVVQDVCAAVGVERPASVFAGINSNRTMAEMLALANEMAHRIAYDTREWTRLVTLTFLDGATGTVAGFNSTAFFFPADYKRMLLTTNVRRSTAPTLPLRFIEDPDQWTERRLRGFASPHGEWMINTGRLFVSPEVPAGTLISFGYLSKNCIALGLGPSGGNNDTFINDDDVFKIDERVLKLGMIWQWKALKGSPYAEDMSNYETALNMVAGADKPAPIFIGRLPISAAVNQSYPFPIDPNMVPL
jgi:hypothetical protein